MTKTQQVAKLKGELEKMNVGPGEIMAINKLADKMFDTYGGESTVSEFRYALLEATKLVLEGVESSFDAAYDIIHTLARETAYNPKNMGGEAESRKRVNDLTRSLFFFTSNKTYPLLPRWRIF